MNNHRSHWLKALVHIPLQPLMLFMRMWVRFSPARLALHLHEDESTDGVRHFISFFFLFFFFNFAAVTMREAKLSLSKDCISRGGKQILMLVRYHPSDTSN